MSFKYNCYISVNTEELRAQLKKIGYFISPLIDSQERSAGILCNQKVAIGVPHDSDEFQIQDYLDSNPHIINCGKNIDLFLAFASIEDNKQNK